MTSKQKRNKPKFKVFKKKHKIKSEDEIIRELQANYDKVEY